MSAGWYKRAAERCEVEQVGPPMELGRWARNAEPGDRFLDPQGKAHTFAGLSGDGVDVWVEDRCHQRRVKDDQGKTRLDSGGRPVLEIHRERATWSPRVIVRGIPRDFQVRAVQRGRLAIVKDE